MNLARPTGEYVERMLTPGGWPGVDENTHYDRAQQYTQVLQQVNQVLGNCRHEQGEVFTGGVWTGNAAGAANNQLEADVAGLVSLQNSLATAITWHRYIAMSLIGAKSDITDNVEDARGQIAMLQGDVRRDEAERTAAIDAVVSAAQGANAGVVAVTAERILASKAWEPPDTALQRLLEQKESPAPGDETPPGSAPGDEESPDSRPGDEDSKGGSWQEDTSPPTPVVPQPYVPGTAAGGVPPSIPGGPRFPGSSPASPTPAAAPAEATVAAGPARGPAASSRSAGDDDDDLAAAPLTDAPPPAGGPPDTSPRMSPASATGMPVMPMASGAAGAGVAPITAAGGGVGGDGMAPGNSPRMSPAAAKLRASAQREPSPSRASTDPAQSADGAAMAMIPASRARIERDAIAGAATADASRRDGTDRLQLARRIAAALNAPVVDLAPDFGFFWVTALMTDGAIVVANSYGLAYIPEGVFLPNQVHMASADQTIPSAERASWATYPMLAVQGWATHRGAQLRAVIATAEQFADSDPGAARVVLQPDDIPDGGEMIGRSRLEVVDPEAAERLAATPEGRLTDLLPPAPADTGPPADERLKLWARLMRTMGSSASGRGTAHVRAFHTYTAHCQQVILTEAHASADPTAQRHAVADWLYWKHLTGQLDAALTEVS
ncbi:hypothetical protein [Mycobacterium sp. Aquia_213]|uniref:hypothetical protein n=1 Tax=Mycobacterium sp. Aquia_213 TaxID=2991728 RepID=UPI00226E5203|nr:hypothetical protein [Mycobacterium sp. Aquia_213]WAC92550.1 hypothetical protein LMQ14_05050 [Mycobacterium sp. Aquia_213]